LAGNITKKLDVNDCSLAHLTLILSLHYLVKYRSRNYELPCTYCNTRGVHRRSLGHA